MLANWIALLMARLPMLENEEGQGMAEYGLILALIAVAVIGVLLTLGPAISNQFQEVQNALPN